MKAIVISKPGGPDVLELREVPGPVPTRDEVGIRVRATAVNRADLLQRMGHYPAPEGAPADIPGLEYAGEIDSIGDAVTQWKVGDRVCGLAGGGTYAERIVAHARTVSRIPEDLSFAEAASVPEAFITAYDAMVTQGRLAAGETVLVSAAGSGVGTAAIQIGRAVGARVIGTARNKSKIDRARVLGMTVGLHVEGPVFAAEVIRVTGGRGVDVILELVGGGYLSEDLTCAAPQARIILVGTMAGTRTELDLGLIMRKRLKLQGTMLRSRPLEEKIAVARMFDRNLAPLFVSGALMPVVDRALPLARAAEAHKIMAANEGFGKIVLEV